MVAVLGTFVGASTATGTGDDTVSDTLSVPGGTSDGDIMLLFSHGPHTAVPTTGTWKFATSNLVWRIASSEPGSYDLGDADNVAILLVYTPSGSLPAGFPGWNVDDVFWAEQGSNTSPTPNNPFSDTESYPVVTDVTTPPTLPVGAFQADQCIDIWAVRLYNTAATPSWSSLTTDTFRSSLLSALVQNATKIWTVQAADNLSAIADASYDVSGLTTLDRHDGGPARYIPRWFTPETPPPPRRSGFADGYWGVLLGEGSTATAPVTPHFPELAAYSLYQGAQATDHDVPYPTGTVPGDLLVMFVGTSVIGTTRTTGTATTWLGRVRGVGYAEGQVLWASPVVGGEDHVNIDFAGATTSRLLAITLRFTPDPGMIFFGVDNPFYIDPSGQLQSGSAPDYDGYGLTSANGTGDFTLSPTKLELDESLYQDNPPAYDHTIAPAQDLRWLQALILSNYDSTNGGDHGGDNALPSTPSGWTLLDQVEDVAGTNTELRLGVYYREQHANEVTFPSVTVLNDNYVAIGGIAGYVFEE
jgi:hypothetical protein